MKLISDILHLIVAGCLGCFCLCSMNPVAGGNSSQTGNNGAVVKASSGQIYGNYRPDVIVAAYESTYQPHNTPSGFCDSTVTDSEGRFMFAALSEGHYNLLIRDTLNGKAAFIHDIPVFADSVFIDTNTVPASSGFCTGKIADRDGQRIVRSFVYITGSPFYTVTESSGEFLLGPLPPGTYRFGLLVTFLPDGTGAVNPSPWTQDTGGTVTIYPDSTTVWK